MKELKIAGQWFLDAHGRKVILRGVNLSGSSKIPFTPDGSTHLKENWPPEDLEKTSFIGRPLREDEIEEHYSRIRQWGFNCLRFLVTWEAIEHAGPYKFDHKYLDYIARLINMANDYGLYVFIDPHQDVWSRVTGGDGMPLWLFDKIGLDYKKFDEAELAINMQYLWDPNKKDNKYRPMSWGENYKYFTNGTMWTLFFGGKDFTPNLFIKDELNNEELNIEDYFQRHFIYSMEEVAKRIKNMPNVMGFDSLNEPNHGFIGQKAFTRNLEANKKNKTQNPPFPGPAWTPIDGMYAASGHSFEIEVIGIKLSKLTLGVIGKKLINPKKISLWKNEDSDFWKKEGVWSLTEEGKPQCMNDNYFIEVNGHKIDFLKDYLLPFASRFTESIRKYNSNWFIFVEDEPDKTLIPRKDGWPKNIPKNMVNAYHWYDPVLSQLQRFLWPITIDISTMKVVVGLKNMEKMYTRQLGYQLKQSEQINNGNCPCLVGEFGCHTNLNKGRSYKIWRRTHDQLKSFKWQTLVMDLMYNALDNLFLNSTQWNYTPENNNQYGDLWNLEDLSLFSRDQQDKDWKEDINSGARGIYGFCRPYARKISGMPIRMQFNRKKGEFNFEFIPDFQITQPTEIFIPLIQFPNGFSVECENASWSLNENKSILFINPLNDNFQKDKSFPIKLKIIKK